MNSGGVQAPITFRFAFFLLGIVLLATFCGSLQAADTPSNADPSMWNTLFGNEVTAPVSEQKKSKPKKAKAHKEAGKSSKLKQKPTNTAPEKQTPIDASAIEEKPNLTSSNTEASTNLNSNPTVTASSPEPFWKGILSGASSRSPFTEEPTPGKINVPAEAVKESDPIPVMAAPINKPATEEEPAFWQKLFGSNKENTSPKVSQPSTSKAPEKPPSPSTGSTTALAIPAEIAPPVAPSNTKVSFALASVCEREKCDLMLLYDAPIDKTTVDKFEQSTISMPEGTTVLLNSATGDLNSGIRLGQYLRQKRFNTRIGRTQLNKKILNEVDGQCFSACVIAFAGGINRRIDPGDQLGVYALRTNSKALNNVQFKSAINSLAGYFDQMGVDRRVIDQMLQTTGMSVSLVSLHNAKLLNLDNSARTITLPWRMQALDDGLLIALVSEKQAAGRYNITLGLTHQNKDFRLTVFIKPLSGAQNLAQLSDFLNTNSRLQLSVANQTLAPSPLKSWEATNSGVQTAVLLTDKELTTMSSVLEFELNLLQTSSNPFGLDGATTFGSTGLKGALTALRK